MDTHINNILAELEAIHTATRQNVDFDVEDRKRAIWYLQGCAISTAYAVYSLYINGNAVVASHEWRFVNEVRDLVALLDIIPDGDRRVKSWYKKKVIERRKNEHENDIDDPMLTADFFREEEQTRRKLLASLSAFVHPTMQVARYNVYKSPHGEIFDYKWGKFREYEEILIIVKSALICAIDCLRSPLRTLNQPQDAWDRLNELYAEAEKVYS